MLFVVVVVPTYASGSWSVVEILVWGIEER